MYTLFYDRLGHANQINLCGLLLSSFPSLTLLNTEQSLDPGTQYCVLSQIIVENNIFSCSQECEIFNLKKPYWGMPQY